jgi:hypothetical protein
VTFLAVCIGLRRPPAKRLEIHRHIHEHAATHTHERAIKPALLAIAVDPAPAIDRGRIRDTCVAQRICRCDWD